MCAPLEHNNLASDKILPPTNHNAPAMRSSYAAAQCPPSTRGPQSAYRPAERAEGGLCALHAAPNPMSEREHELHRRMTSLTERHRAWPRSWARTERAVPRDPFAAGVRSSPHTRGTRPEHLRDAHGVEDHPRIRGEHDVAPVGGHDDHGIIPAYAGNTMSCRWITPQAAGSSSHTRGTLINVVNGCSLIRDHPRIRGDHLPETRKRLVPLGIIPAYTGNTYGIYAVACGYEDHPRIRGEHLPLRSLLLGEIGIIPAYAGNTRRR